MGENKELFNAILSDPQVKIVEQSAVWDWQPDMSSRALQREHPRRSHIPSPAGRA
jgi:hypothetical protein